MAAVSAWYYMRGREAVGPVTQEQLCTLFEGGSLGLETMVWGEAFRGWVPASAISGFRAVYGGATGTPGTGGVLEYEREARGPVGFGGWLIWPLLGRVHGPLRTGVGAMVYGFNTAQMEANGGRSAVTLQVLAGVMAVMTVYELATSSLFFSRKRVAVPLVMGSYVWGVVQEGVILWAGAGIATRTGRVDEKVAMYLGVSAIVAVLWIWYFMVSKRVRATFVR